MGRFFSLQISKVLEVPLIRMERFFEVVPNSFGPKMQNIFYEMLHFGLAMASDIVDCNIQMGF